jgi:hypothetical protein
MRFFKNSRPQIKLFVSGCENLPEDRILGGNETNTKQIPYQVNNCAELGMKESTSVVMKCETHLKNVI